MHSIADGWLWSIFIALFFVVFGIDLFLVGGRGAKVVSARAALLWTGIWISCAFIFNFFLWRHLIPIEGPTIAKQKALEFLAGYLIEKSLSVDNMFVILMIFKSLAIPLMLQRRVLLYGVIGALIMRFCMIFAGVWLISKFQWLLYFFAAFLIWSGGKMLFMKTEDEHVDVSKNVVVRWIKKLFHVTDTLHEEHFFVRMGKYWYMTPLFIALVMVEISDLVFALDSIPAIFAITLDPFIVFTSNMFAILGLRALYFLLAHAARRFSAIQYGVALILMLTGVKMLLSHWYKLPVFPMLMLIVLILVATAVGGVLWEKRKRIQH